MKRIKVTFIIILLSVLVLTMQCMTAPVYADTQKSISDAEALDLIYNALNMFNHVQMATDSVFNMNDSFRDGDHTYYLVYEEKLPSGSFDALKEYAKTIYTDAVASQMYAHVWRENDVTPIFKTGENGKLYMTPCHRVPSLSFGYDDLFGKGFSAEVLTVKVVNAVGNEATVWVKVSEFADTNEQTAYWMECKLINTVNGWRIDQSSFTDYLQYERVNMQTLIEYGSSPATADADYSMVIALSLTALAALIPAALVVRKRRKYSYN